MIGSLHSSQFLPVDIIIPSRGKGNPTRQPFGYPLHPTKRFPVRQFLCTFSVPPHFKQVPSLDCLSCVAMTAAVSSSPIVFSFFLKALHIFSIRFFASSKTCSFVAF